MRNPAKVLEISPYPPPHSGWGVRVAKVKEELRRQGHDCVVLNIGESRKVKSKEYEDVQHGWDYVRKLFRYCRRGYAVHMHLNGQSLKGFVLTLISELISLIFIRRAILTFHAGTHQTFFPRANSVLFVPVLAVIFLLSRRIICNDEAVKRLICQYGVRPTKVKPIQAFSAQYLEFEDAGIGEDLEEFFRNHSPVLMSYICLRPAFHVDTTLEALALLTRDWPDIGLVLVGSTDKVEDMDGQAIFDLIERLGLSRNLVWVGDVAHDVFLSILKRSQLFLRSYEFDGVCSSVLEALSLGVPVVGCENELRPAQVRLFKSGDHRDLASRVAEVLQDYEQVRGGLEVPQMRDTLAEEIAVLVEPWLRRSDADRRSVSGWSEG